MKFEDIDLEVTMQTSNSLLILFSKKDSNHTSKNYSIIVNFVNELEAKKFYETLQRIYDALREEEHRYKEW